MNPSDKTGQLRHRVRELIGSDRLSGRKFSDDDLEEIIEALEE